MIGFSYCSRLHLMMLRGYSPKHSKLVHLKLDIESTLMVNNIQISTRVWLIGSRVILPVVLTCLTTIEHECSYLLILARAGKQHCWRHAYTFIISVIVGNVVVVVVVASVGYKSNAEERRVKENCETLAAERMRYALKAARIGNLCLIYFYIYDYTIFFLLLPPFFLLSFFFSFFFHLHSFWKITLLCVH